jgi:aryl-alcohol dehydrogenase-like predicted oxidoreductase
MRNLLSNKLISAADALLGPLPRRTLGKTGLSVSIIGLGGESLLKKESSDRSDDKYSEAIDYVRRALELGINYFDTAPIYYPSEPRLGEALKGVNRSEIILASKTDKRDRDGAWRQLDASLKNLKTDYLDIWQIHHIDHQDEVKQIFAEDGAMKALQEAKDQGMVRYLGVTGHYDPKPLLSCIKRFDFDTLLMVTNAADVHKHSMIKNLMPEALKKKIGVLGMKVCSRGRLFDPMHITNMDQALPYVLTLPISSVIIGHDNIGQLEQNIRIAKSFDPLSNKEMDRLEDMTKEYANLALFYRKGFEEYNPFWSAYGQKKGGK